MKRLVRDYIARVEDALNGNDHLTLSENLEALDAIRLLIEQRAEGIREDLVHQEMEALEADLETFTPVRA